MKQLVKEINEIFENANIDGETIEILLLMKHIVY